LDPPKIKLIFGNRCCLCKWSGESANYLCSSAFLAECEFPALAAVAEMARHYLWMAWGMIAVEAPCRVPNQVSSHGQCGSRLAILLLLLIRGFDVIIKRCARKKI